MKHPFTLVPAVICTELLRHLLTEQKDRQMGEQLSQSLEAFINGRYGIPRNLNSPNSLSHM